MGLETSDPSEDQPYDILEDSELLEDIVKYNGEDQDEQES